MIVEKTNDRQVIVNRSIKYAKYNYGCEKHNDRVLARNLEWPPKSILGDFVPETLWGA